VDRVVPLAAEQRLRSRASGEGVVAVSTVDRRRDAGVDGPVALVDAHGVVAGSGIDGDPCDLLALEAEVGRAVVPDVDLENVGVSRLEAKRELVARNAALDCEHAVSELREGRGGLNGRRGCGRCAAAPGAA